jgi:hypothetical protein
MSSYHETCPKCEDETITHGWSPVKCPFCEIEELRKQRDMLAEDLECLVVTCEAIDCAVMMPAAMPDAYSKAKKTLAAVKGGGE